MKLNKILTSVNFEPSIFFDDTNTIDSLIKGLKNLLPLYQLNREQGVLALLNPENNTKCIIQNNKIAIDIDQAKDIESFKSLSAKIIPDIISRLRVETTNRIGVRAFYLKESVSTGKESAELIYKTFLNINNVFIKNHSNEESFQPRAGLSFKVSNDFFLNINIGYHQIGSGQVKNNQLIKLGITATHPLTDIDIFTNTPKTGVQFKDVLENCCSELEKYSHMVWNEGY